MNDPTGDLIGDAGGGIGSGDAVAVRVRRLPHAEGLDLPAYRTAGAAGLDLLAALNPGQSIVLEPGARDLVPTGLVLALPGGYEAQVRPRSGLALHHGVTVLNSPGTVDADYRGEVGVVLINHGAEPFRIERGARIAQLVLARVERLAWVEAPVDGPDAFGHGDTTARGVAGFGSTGHAPDPDLGSEARPGSGRG